MATEILNTSAESLESLLREVETLKTKLEDERQKLDDISCNNIFMILLQYYCKN